MNQPHGKRKTAQDSSQQIKRVVLTRIEASTLFGLRRRILKSYTYNSNRLH